MRAPPRSLSETNDERGYSPEHSGAGSAHGAGGLVGPDPLGLARERLLHRRERRPDDTVGQRVVEHTAEHHQPAQERRVRDPARAALDRAHRAVDRRLQGPRPADRPGAPALRRLEDRRGLTRRDHRRVEEQVVRHAHGHPEVAHLDPQRAPERLHTRLGRAVGAEPRCRQHGRRRRDQQQMPTPLDHMRERGAHGPPHAEQVHVERVGDRVRPHEPQRPAGRDARVGHRHIDPAEPRGEPVDRRRQRLAVAHVGHRGLGPADARRDRLQTRGVDIDQRLPHPA
jgi:hypothetical protein